MNNTLFSKYLGEILFTVFLIIGINSFTQYGIAWDEPQQRLTGLVNYDYIMNINDQLLTWQDRDYGVAIELPLIALEKLLGLNSTREIFVARHLFTHILFLIGALFFYKLAFQIFKNEWISALGFLLIVSQPLLYGHSFFNSKDLPFLSVFIISLHQTAIYFKHKNILNTLILGVLIGVLMNIRLMGVMVPMVVITFMVLDSILYKRIYQHLAHIILLLIISLSTLIFTWPFLWSNPIENFQFAFENMSKFRFDREMLFLGEFILPTEIKWYYIPVWFSITNPIIYLFAGVIGLATFAFHFVKSPLTFIFNTKNRNILFATIFFTVPVLAIIVLKSVLYDSWRQMFFIYPPFVILILHGVFQLKTISKKGHYAAIGLITLSIIQMGWFIQSNFPLEHNFFNELISYQKSNYAIKNFENDYWGLSYKPGFEYILKIDNSTDINVAVQNMPGYLNEDMLSVSGENRIHTKTIIEADYFLTEYRFHSFAPDSLEQYKYHAIIVSNSTVLQIYKLK